jgi:hypothetical protein
VRSRNRLHRKQIVAILNEWPHEKFFTPFHGFSAGIVRVLFSPSNSLQNPAFPDPTFYQQTDRLSPCFSRQCKRILFYCDVNSFKGLKSQSIFLPHMHRKTAFAPYS